MEFLKFMNESGAVGWFILGVGFTCIALVGERFYALFVKYHINAEFLMAKVQSLIIARKYEQALVLCAEMKHKPLAQAFKGILERSDRDEDAIFQAQEIALAENLPHISKRLHYLSMLANVATLLGLLGTIHGLILSFQAVASADPSQKQALLASGISVSMYTTALGLAVAIPAMVFYSVLVARQNSMTEDLVEKTSKLTELLTNPHAHVQSNERVS